MIKICLRDHPFKDLGFGNIASSDWSLMSIKSNRQRKSNLCIFHPQQVQSKHCHCHSSQFWFLTQTDNLMMGATTEYYRTRLRGEAFKTWKYQNSSSRKWPKSIIVGYSRNPLILRISLLLLLLFLPSLFFSNNNFPAPSNFPPFSLSSLPQGRNIWYL